MNEYLYLGITTAQVLTFKQAQLKCHFGGIFTHPERKKAKNFPLKFLKLHRTTQARRRIIYNFSHHHHHLPPTIRHPFTLPYHHLNESCEVDKLIVRPLEFLLGFLSSKNRYFSSPENQFKIEPCTERAPSLISRAMWDKRIIYRHKSFWNWRLIQW